MLAPDPLLPSLTNFSSADSHSRLHTAVQGILPDYPLRVTATAEIRGSCEGKSSATVPARLEWRKPPERRHQPEDISQVDRCDGLASYRHDSEWLQDQQPSRDFFGSNRRQSSLHDTHRKGFALPKSSSPEQQQNRHINLENAELTVFRTRICERNRSGRCQNSDRCPHSHCQTWQRRNPSEYAYSSRLCPEIEFVKKGSKMTLVRRCSRGRRCEFAHSKEEELYHPTVYKTKMCNSRPTCTRYFCPFAHSQEELRRGGETTKGGDCGGNPGSKRMPADTPSAVTLEEITTTTSPPTRNNCTKKTLSIPGSPTSSSTTASSTTASPLLTSMMPFSMLGRGEGGRIYGDVSPPTSPLYGQSKHYQQGRVPLDSNDDNAGNDDNSHQSCFRLPSSIMMPERSKSDYIARGGGGQKLCDLLAQWGTSDKDLLCNGNEEGATAPCQSLFTSSSPSNCFFFTPDSKKAMGGRDGAPSLDKVYSQREDRTGTSAADSQNSRLSDDLLLVIAAALSDGNNGASNCVTENISHASRNQSTEQHSNDSAMGYCGSLNENDPDSLLLLTALSVIGSLDDDNNCNMSHDDPCGTAYPRIEDDSCSHNLTQSQLDLMGPPPPCSSRSTRCNSNSSGGSTSIESANPHDSLFAEWRD